MTLNKNSFLLGLMVFSLLDIPVLKMGVFAYVFIALNTVLLITYTLKYYLIIMHNTRKKFFLCILLYSVVTIFSSIFNGVVTIGILYSIYYIYLVVNILFIESDRALAVLYYVFAFVAIITFISFVFFKDQCYELNNLYCCVLGGKNALPRTLLPACIVFLLYYYKTRKKLVFFLIGISLFTMYAAGSGTAIVTSIMMVILLLILRKTNIPGIMYFIVYFITEIFVLNIHKLSSINLLNNILSSLNKDFTFTQRTFVWEVAEKSIADKWLLGNGRGNFITVFGQNYLETHNVILQIFFWSGIIGLILYGCTIYFAGKKRSKYRTIEENILCIGIFLFMIDGLMESVQDSIGIWILLCLLYIYSTKTQICKKEKLKGN